MINDGGVSTLDTETGKVGGLIMDYIQLAQNCLEGQTLKFNLKGYDSQENIQKALHDGEIDMIFHVMQNPNAAEELGYDLTDTVWKYNMAAVTVKKVLMKMLKIRLRYQEKTVIWSHMFPTIIHSGM